MAASPGARVSIFLGKGGVGKTTLACAFAAERAAAGERVLLTSFTLARDLAERVRSEGDALATHDRLEIATLDPRCLVDDLVRKVTRLGPMADLVLRQPGYESLVDIAPGVKEMAIFNYVWNRRRDGLDRIVVDGPATGHGLHFLEAPEKTARILVGRLRDRALEIRGMLQDPTMTEAVVVTLPEETPIRETLELANVLKKQGMALDNVVVNKWLPRVFETPETADILAKLESDATARETLERALAKRGPIEVAPWLEALALIRSQRREAVAHVRALEATGAKLAVVPYFPDSAGRLAKVAAAMRAPFEIAEARAA